MDIHFSQHNLLKTVLSTLNDFGNGLQSVQCISWYMKSCCNTYIFLLIPNPVMDISTLQSIFKLGHVCPQTLLFFFQDSFDSSKILNLWYEYQDHLVSFCQKIHKQTMIISYNNHLSGQNHDFWPLFLLDHGFWISSYKKSFKDIITHSLYWSHSPTVHTSLIRYSVVNKMIYFEWIIFA